MYPCCDDCRGLNSPFAPVPLVGIRRSRRRRRLIAQQKKHTRTSVAHCSASEVCTCQVICRTMLSAHPYTHCSPLPPQKSRLPFQVIHRAFTFRTLTNISPTFLTFYIVYNVQCQKYLRKVTASVLARHQTVNSLNSTRDQTQAHLS